MLFLEKQDQKRLVGVLLYKCGRLNSPAPVLREGSNQPIIIPIYLDMDGKTVVRKTVKNIPNGFNVQT